jgi:hypothetical protein
MRYLLLPEFGNQHLLHDHIHSELLHLDLDFVSAHGAKVFGELKMFGFDTGLAKAESGGKYEWPQVRVMGDTKGCKQMGQS